MAEQQQSGQPREVDRLEVAEVVVHQAELQVEAGHRAVVEVAEHRQRVWRGEVVRQAVVAAAPHHRPGLREAEGLLGGAAVGERLLCGSQEEEGRRVGAVGAGHHSLVLWRVRGTLPRRLVGGLPGQ